MTDHSPSGIAVDSLPLRSRIGFRMLVMILAVISLLTVVSLAIRYRALDRQNRKDIDERLDEISLSHVPALAENFWTMNSALLRINLKSLVDLQEVSYARITDLNNRTIVEVADAKIKRGLETVPRVYHLSHTYNGTVHYLGDLYVETSLEPGRKRAHDELVYDILSVIARLAVLAILLQIGIRLLVVKPLSELAGYARKLHPDRLGEPISVSRMRFWGKAEDELDQVITAFNDMQQNLAAAYQQLQAANQALAEDVFRQKQAEAALLQAKEELESRIGERTEELSRTYEQLLHAEKLSAVGKLAASVAHEFNNPLFGIRNVLKGIARRVTLAVEDRELVTMAVRECDRIKDLIANLQQFNRPTSGVFAMVDVHQAIREMILLCNKKMSSRGLTIETQFAPALPKIEAIEDQLKQVMLNLLNNAEEAVANDTGHIRIRTEHCHATVVIRVEDNGSGIAEEDVKHVFEPFFTTKSAVKGTGLGLSISYGIIKRHGGNVLVRSKPGEGSTFIVTLPIRQEKGDVEGTDSAG